MKALPFVLLGVVCHSSLSLGACDYGPRDIRVGVSVTGKGTVKVSQRAGSSTGLFSTCSPAQRE